MLVVTHDNARDMFSAQEDRLITIRAYKYLIPMTLALSRPGTSPTVYYFSNEENITAASTDGQGMTLIDDLWWIPPPSEMAVTLGSEYAVG